MNKIYKLDIEFPVSFFKVPYTVKTRKCYLIPRKKSIISIFNSFFEKPISFWKFTKSKKLENENKLIENFLVGVELIYFEKTLENQQIKQYKDKVLRTLSNTELLINTRYVFYLVTDLELKLNPINYHPFAGQNDYLAYSWKLERINGEIQNIEEKETTLKNYQLIPKNNITPKNDSEIIIENMFEDYVVCKGRIVLRNLNLLKTDNEEIVLL